MRMRFCGIFHTTKSNGNKITLKNIPCFISYLFEQKIFEVLYAITKSREKSTWLKYICFLLRKQLNRRLHGTCISVNVYYAVALWSECRMLLLVHIILNNFNVNKNLKICYFIYPDIPETDRFCYGSPSWY